MPQMTILASALALGASLAAPSLLHAQTRPITYEDFAAIKGVSDPQVSPDGRSVLYAVRTTDVDGNRRSTVTYVVPAGGGVPRAFPDDTTRASEARWAANGQQVAYVAGGQLWVANADGSARRKLTTLNGGATGIVWAPTSDRILFTSAVYPDCPTDACNAERAGAAEASKVKAHATEQLLFRHWTAWDDGTRSHLFVVGADGNGLVDLTKGARYDVPVPPFGGSEQYAVSPDGREVAYTAKDAGRTDAWSTDLNLYTVPIAGGTPVVVTKANAGADQNPVYSPDGKYIAYASQRQAAFESDRWRMMLYDRAAKQSRELLPRWDRSAGSYFFAPDGRGLFIDAEDRGRDKLFFVALDAAGAAATPQPALVFGEHHNTAFSTSSDGRTVAWVHESASRPPEIHLGALDAGKLLRHAPLTHINDALVAQLDLRPAEDFAFVGAAGDSVHGFIVRPPGFKAGEKYPVVLLIHGGPQGAWLDNWSTRWSYQMWAAPGFGLVIINPHGSTGYGQAFTNAVSKDWGGKTYQDLMRGLTIAVSRNAWMDSTRMGAAGGSYGGYMANWMLGHTDRFKALVSHAGVFNLESMYGATEELWFTDWEFGGGYWDPKASAEQYRKYSPHLFVRSFKTPTLVLHGEQDFRVPYTEGLQLFTALQRRNVPSRLVVFPDEGHWILKPQNARLWWKEVQGWMTRYLSPGKVS
jgi:dipeptidyl aminopeptidase/acylaminoacyl peptidase